MYKSDWFILIFTFFIGGIVGASLYVTSFAPTFGIGIDGPNREEREASRFSISARTYGGMLPAEYERPSFRVTGDGTYTFIEGGRGEQQTETGTLPKGLFEDVEIAVLRADLERLETETEKDMCRSFADGNEYIYEITLEGAQYTLDTCKTALPYDHQLALVLEDIWRYLLTGGSVIDSSRVPTDGTQEETSVDDTETRRGLGGLLERRLREIFVEGE